MHNKLESMIWNNIKSKIIHIINAIKNNIIIISKGEYQHFNRLLYIWGLLPGILITLFIQNKLPNTSNLFFSILSYSLIVFYFAWHLFAIIKTLKVQPQYKVKKITKKELYEGKTSEEIKNIKKQKREDNIKKLLLLKAWDSSPSYVIIEIFDLFIILSQIQRFFYIINR